MALAVVVVIVHVLEKTSRQRDQRPFVEVVVAVRQRVLPDMQRLSLRNVKNPCIRRFLLLRGMLRRRAATEDGRQCERQEDSLHQRVPFCLLGGTTSSGKDFHVVLLQVQKLETDRR